MQLMKPVVAMDEAVKTDSNTTPEVLADLPPLHALVKVSQPHAYSVCWTLRATYSIHVFVVEHFLLQDMYSTNYTIRYL